MDFKPILAEESVDVLPEYSRIPISFEVHSVFQVELVEGGLQGIRLSERPVTIPWTKDYDAIKGEGPMNWASRWDISKWGVISAFTGETRLGGCVIAYDTPGVHKLDGRKDIAVLWDIRVMPKHRGDGIGSLLGEATVAWAKHRSCRMLMVETQNINVPACRFYSKHRFELASINRYAYAELPDEVELIWCKQL